MLNTFTTLFGVGRHIRRNVITFILVIAALLGAAAYGEEKPKQSCTGHKPGTGPEYEALNKSKQQCDTFLEVLGGVKEQVDTIKKSYAKAGEKFDSFAGSATNAQASIDATKNLINKSISELEAGKTNLQKVVKNVGKVEELSQGAHSALVGAEAKLSQKKTEIENLTKNYATRMNDLGSRINNIKTRMAANPANSSIGEANLKLLEPEHTKLKADMEKKKEEHAKIVAAIKDYAGGRADQKAVHGGAAKLDKEVKGEIAKVESSVSGLKEKLAKLEKVQLGEDKEGKGKEETAKADESKTPEQRKAEADKKAMEGMSGAPSMDPVKTVAQDNAAKELAKKEAAGGSGAGPDTEGDRAIRKAGEDSKGSAAFNKGADDGKAAGSYASGNEGLAGTQTTHEQLDALQRNKDRLNANVEELGGPEGVSREMKTRVDKLADIDKKLEGAASFSRSQTPPEVTKLLSDRKAITDDIASQPALAVEGDRLQIKERTLKDASKDMSTAKYDTEVFGESAVTVMKEDATHQKFTSDTSVAKAKAKTEAPSYASDVDTGLSRTNRDIDTKIDRSVAIGEQYKSDVKNAERNASIRSAMVNAMSGDTYMMHSGGVEFTADDMKKEALGDAASQQNYGAGKAGMRQNSEDKKMEFAGAVTDANRRESLTDTGMLVASVVPGASAVDYVRANNAVKTSESDYYASGFDRKVGERVEEAKWDRTMAVAGVGMDVAGGAALKVVGKAGSATMRGAESLMGSGAAAAARASEDVGAAAARSVGNQVAQEASYDVARATSHAVPNPPAARAANSFGDVADNGYSGGSRQMQLPGETPSTGKFTTTTEGRWANEAANVPNPPAARATNSFGDVADNGYSGGSKQMQMPGEAPANGRFTTSAEGRWTSEAAAGRSAADYEPPSKVFGGTRAPEVEAPRPGRSVAGTTDNASGGAGRASGRTSQAADDAADWGVANSVVRRSADNAASAGADTTRAMAQAGQGFTTVSQALSKGIANSPPGAAQAARTSIPSTFSAPPSTAGRTVVVPSTRVSGQLASSGTGNLGSSLGRTSTRAADAADGSLAASLQHSGVNSLKRQGVPESTARDLMSQSSDAGVRAKVFNDPALATKSNAEKAEISRLANQARSESSGASAASRSAPTSAPAGGGRSLASQGDEIAGQVASEGRSAGGVARTANDSSYDAFAGGSRASSGSSFRGSRSLASTADEVAGPSARLSDAATNSVDDILETGGKAEAKAADTVKKAEPAPSRASGSVAKESDEVAESVAKAERKAAGDAAESAATPKKKPRWQEIEEEIAAQEAKMPTPRERAKKLFEDKRDPIASTKDLREAERILDDLDPEALSAHRKSVDGPLRRNPSEIPHSADAEAVADYVRKNYPGMKNPAEIAQAEKQVADAARRYEQDIAKSAREFAPKSLAKKSADELAAEATAKAERLAKADQLEKADRARRPIGFKTNAAEIAEREAKVAAPAQRARELAHGRPETITSTAELRDAEKILKQLDPQALRMHQADVGGPLRKNLADIPHSGDQRAISDYVKSNYKGMTDPREIAQAEKQVADAARQYEKELADSVKKIAGKEAPTPAVAKSVAKAETESAAARAADPTAGSKFYDAFRAEAKTAGKGAGLADEATSVGKTAAKRSDEASSVAKLTEDASGASKAVKAVDEIPAPKTPAGKYKMADNDWVEGLENTGLLSIQEQALRKKHGIPDYLIDSSHSNERLVRATIEHKVTDDYGKHIKSFGRKGVYRDDELTKLIREAQNDLVPKVQAYQKDLFAAKKAKAESLAKAADNASPAAAKGSSDAAKAAGKSSDEVAGAVAKKADEPAAVAKPAKLSDEASGASKAVKTADQAPAGKYKMADNDWVEGLENTGLLAIQEQALRKKHGIPNYLIDSSHSNETLVRATIEHKVTDDYGKHIKSFGRKGVYRDEELTKLIREAQNDLVPKVKAYQKDLFAAKQARAENLAKGAENARPALAKNAGDAARAAGKSSDEVAGGVAKSTDQPAAVAKSAKLSDEASGASKATKTADNAPSGKYKMADNDWVEGLENTGLLAIQEQALRKKHGIPDYLIDSSHSSETLVRATIEHKVADDYGKHIKSFGRKGVYRDDELTKLTREAQNDLVPKVQAYQKDLLAAKQAKAESLAKAANNASPAVVKNGADAAKDVAKSAEGAGSAVAKAANEPVAATKAAKLSDDASGASKAVKAVDEIPAPKTPAGKYKMADNDWVEGLENTGLLSIQEQALRKKHGIPDYLIDSSHSDERLVRATIEHKVTDDYGKHIKSFGRKGVYRDEELTKLIREAQNDLVPKVKAYQKDLFAAKQAKAEGLAKPAGDVKPPLAKNSGDATKAVGKSSDEVAGSAAKTADESTGASKLAKATEPAPPPSRPKNPMGDNDWAPGLENPRTSGMRQQALRDKHDIPRYLTDSSNSNIRTVEATIEHKVADDYGKSLGRKGKFSDDDLEKLTRAAKADLVPKVKRYQAELLALENGTAAPGRGLASIGRAADEAGASVAKASDDAGKVTAAAAKASETTAERGASTAVKQSDELAQAAAKQTEEVTAKAAQATEEKTVEASAKPKRRTWQDVEKEIEAREALEPSATQKAQRLVGDKKDPITSTAELREAEKLLKELDPDGLKLHRGDSGNALRRNTTEIPHSGDPEAISNYVKQNYKGMSNPQEIAQTERRVAEAARDYEKSVANSLRRASKQADEISYSAPTPNRGRSISEQTRIVPDPQEIRAAYANRNKALLENPQASSYLGEARGMAERPARISKEGREKARKIAEKFETREVSDVYNTGKGKPLTRAEKQEIAYRRANTDQIDKKLKSDFADFKKNPDRYGPDYFKNASERLADEQLALLKKIGRPDNEKIFVPATIVDGKVKTPSRYIVKSKNAYADAKDVKAANKLYKDPTRGSTANRSLESMLKSNPNYEVYIDPIELLDLKAGGYYLKAKNKIALDSINSLDASIDASTWGLRHEANHLVRDAANSEIRDKAARIVDHLEAGKAPAKKWDWQLKRELKREYGGKIRPDQQVAFDKELAKRIRLRDEAKDVLKKVKDEKGVTDVARLDKEIKQKKFDGRFTANEDAKLSDFELYQKNMSLDEVKTFGQDVVEALSRREQANFVEAALGKNAVPDGMAHDFIAQSVEGFNKVADASRKHLTNIQDSVSKMTYYGKREGGELFAIEGRREGIFVTTSKGSVVADVPLYDGNKVIGRMQIDRAKIGADKLSPEQLKEFVKKEIASSIQSVDAMQDSVARRLSRANPLMERFDMNGADYVRPTKAPAPSKVPSGLKVAGATGGAAGVAGAGYYAFTSGESSDRKPAQASRPRPEEGLLEEKTQSAPAVPALAPTKKPNSVVLSDPQPPSIGARPKADPAPSVVLQPKPKVSKPKPKSPRKK